MSYRVRLLVHHDGERLPCLVDTKGMPVVLPNEYIYTHRGKAWTTLDKELRVLLILSIWEEEASLNI